MCIGTKWAPLLLSASGLSLLTGQRLGGFLDASFSSWHLQPLNRESSLELVFCSAEAFNLTVDDAFAEAVWLLTEGYPYSIQSLITSFNAETQNYPDLDALQDVLVFELANRMGQLWQHHSQEFLKYEQLLNEGQSTKQVMFWATKYPEERIHAKRVAKELAISVEAVQAALPKLNEADIVQRVGWRIYNGRSDPMLRRYIEYNYWRDYEKLSFAEAIQNWKEEYSFLCGHLKKRTRKSSPGT